MKTKEFEFRSFQADMWWMSQPIPNGFSVAVSWVRQDEWPKVSWCRKILNKLGA